MIQIDEYRAQLREQTKSGRDLKMQIHKLETQVCIVFFYEDMNFFKIIFFILFIQLSELEYYKARNAEMTEELYMYKAKVEKIPSLLAETARLRAYSNTIYLY